MCKSDVAKFVQSVNAIYAALHAAGLELSHGLYEDKDGPDRNQPCGTLHLIVGSRL
jgi:hypothetical protein